MRIIGNIEHPVLKITIFKMDNRLSVKFEQGYLEQTYKFRQQDGLEGVSAVRQMVDDQFLAGVVAQFQQMKEVHESAVNRHFPPPSADEFETII